MKITVLPFLIVSILLTSCQKIQQEYNGLSLNAEHENTIKKSYNFEFDEIEVSTSIDAEIIKSDEEKVVIEAPVSIMEHVHVENNGKKLHIFIRTQGFFNNIRTHQIKAKIYARDFNRLAANSSADITVKDKFLSEKMKVSVSSSGSVSGNLEANDFEIGCSSSADFSGNIWAINLIADVNSSGNIDLEGKVKNAEVGSSSSGDFTASGLVAETAKLSASSSGSISMAVSHTLNARASSSGSIRVRKAGNLNVLSAEEGSSGTVKVLN